MKLQEAIDRCDDLRPNQYSPEEKIRWLNDVESKIQAEVIQTHANTENLSFDGYTVESLGNALLIKPPYSDLYIKYLMAQIDFNNGEMERYNNSAIMFNVAYTDFSNHYHATHLPVSKHEIKV